MYCISYFFLPCSILLFRDDELPCMTMHFFSKRRLQNSKVFMTDLKNLLFCSMLACAIHFLPCAWFSAKKKKREREKEREMMKIQYFLHIWWLGGNRREISTSYTNRVAHRLPTTFTVTSLASAYTALKSWTGMESKYAYKFGLSVTGLQSVKLRPQNVPCMPTMQLKYDWIQTRRRQRAALQFHISSKNSYLKSYPVFFT